jgi:hypothetical protein
MRIKAFRNSFFKEFYMAMIFQMLGLASVAIGITMWSIPAGIVFAGCALVLVGLALEKGR